MKKTLIVCLILFGAAAMASAAGRQIIVSPQWVAARLDSGYVLLHVVSLRADYTREHLPGARMLWQWSISESTPERNSEPLALPILDSVLKEIGINKDSKIILYYGLGEVTAAARVYVMFDWLGLGDQTYLMNCGLEAWKAAGLPLTKEIPKFHKGNYKPKLHPEVLAELDYVKAHYRSDGVKMVDCRTAQVFNQVSGLGVVRGGHIPGAVSIPWPVVIDTAMWFRPLDSIGLKVVEAGIKPTDELITYCGSGRTSCLHYIVLKELGYKVKMYDGSYEEWSRLEDLPIEINPPKPEEKPKTN
jgi:thiosulfate/3-mercaptopyruvate sulfurtransferase